jgi:hypothetical protein
MPWKSSKSKAVKGTYRGEEIHKGAESPLTGAPSLRLSKALRRARRAAERIARLMKMSRLTGTGMHVQGIRCEGCGA